MTTAMTVADLESLRDAGVALNETGAERLRAAEQNREAAEAQREARVAAARKTFNRETPKYVEAQQAVVDGIQNLLALAEVAHEKRAVVEQAFRVLYAHDAIPSGSILPPRIATRATMGERDLYSLDLRLRATAFGDL